MGQYRVSEKTESRLRAYLRRNWQKKPGNPSSESYTFDDAINEVLDSLEMLEENQKRGGSE